MPLLKVRLCCFSHSSTHLWVVVNIGFASQIFTKKALTVSASTLAPTLQKIWKVPPSVMKVLILPSLDESAQPGEDIYVDVRAKAKPERTKTVVDVAMQDMSKLFKEHGYSANIR